MWQFILNFLFPSRCVNCGRPGQYLCPRCSLLIRIIEPNQQVCPVCEKPAIGGATHPKCQTKSSLDGLTSFFVYDGPLKKAIKLLKYKLVTDLASELVLKAFALSLTPPWRGKGFSKATPYIEDKRAFSINFASARYEANVLTPVPLHWRRLNWRGFNQSELLGKLMSEKLNIKFVPNLLIRKRYTKPQVELTEKQRKVNIEGAFTINPRYSALCHKLSAVCIFDDVWTTGATLKTCGKVLKEAGAKKVWGLTLAR